MLADFSVISINGTNRRRAVDETVYLSIQDSEKEYREDSIFRY